MKDSVRKAVAVCCNPTALSGHGHTVAVRQLRRWLLEGVYIDIFEKEYPKNHCTLIPSGGIGLQTPSGNCGSKFRFMGKNMCLISHWKKKMDKKYVIAWIYTLMTLHSLVLCILTVTETYLDNECHRRKTADMECLN